MKQDNNRQAEFRGYFPYWIGSFDSSVDLGGGEKYHHCCGTSFGIADSEWWITSELEKLSNADMDELESIMKRNKWFHDEIKTYDKIKALSDYFGVDTSVLYRMGAKNLYILFKTLNDIYNEILHKFDFEISSTTYSSYFDIVISGIKLKEEHKNIEKLNRLFNKKEDIKLAIEL